MICASCQSAQWLYSKLALVGSKLNNMNISYHVTKGFQFGVQLLALIAAGLTGFYVGAILLNTALLENHTETIGIVMGLKVFIN
jgi:hypothetical protein